MPVYVTKSFMPSIRGYNEYVERIFNRSILTNQGPLVQELQKKLSEFLGVKNFHYVTNGTLALQLALAALDIFPRLSRYDKIVCITDDFLNEFKRKISERAKDIKLFVVGDGPKASEFKKYTSKLKSAKQIVFWGSLDNPFGLMHGAIANILSSEHEGFGMVPVESMALATLIICSNYKCGAREILEDGQNGLLFEIGNAPMLAKCMSDALDPQLREKKIQKAYKSLSRFSVNNTTKQIVDLLQSFGGNK